MQLKIDEIAVGRQILDSSPGTPLEQRSPLVQHSPGTPLQVQPSPEQSTQIDQGLLCICASYIYSVFRSEAYIGQHLQIHAHTVHITGIIISRV